MSSKAHAVPARIYVVGFAEGAIGLHGWCQLSLNGVARGADDWPIGETDDSNLRVNYERVDTLGTQSGFVHAL